MIKITDANDDKQSFTFLTREYPEEIKFDKKATINHIEYAGGFQTNQLIGVYNQPLDWSGLFYGTYNGEKGTILANHKANTLHGFVGKVVNIEINEHKKMYLVESVELKVKNPTNVEYSIKLVPHQTMEKIKIDANSTMRVEFKPEDISNAAANAGKKGGKLNSKDAKKKVKDANKEIAKKTGGHDKEFSEGTNPKPKTPKKRNTIYL